MPLTYWHGGNGNLSIQKLKSEFLSISFSSIEKNTYPQNGLIPYLTLAEVFKNVYTQESGDKPQVRSMNENDICNVTQLDKMSYNDMGLVNSKYCELLNNGGIYWIPSTINNNMWKINPNSPIPWPYDTSKNIEWGIRPVVSLKSNAKTKGIDLEGIQQLEI